MTKKKDDEAVRGPDADGPDADGPVADDSAIDLPLDEVATAPPLPNLEVICDFLEEYREYQKRGRGPSTYAWRAASAEIEMLQAALGRKQVDPEPDNGADGEEGD